VDVDHASCRDRQHLRPKNVAIGDNDAEVWLQPPKAGEKDIADGANRLEDR
jgi:hypothetical protein